MSVFVFTHVDGTKNSVTIKNINDELPQHVLNSLKKDAESFSNPIARDKYSSIKTKKDLDDFIEWLLNLPCNKCYPTDNSLNENTKNVAEEKSDILTGSDELSFNVEQLTFFQDPANVEMYQLVTLHNNLCYYLYGILCVVL